MKYPIAPVNSSEIEQDSNKKSFGKGVRFAGNPREGLSGNGGGWASPGATFKMKK